MLEGVHAQMFTYVSQVPLLAVSQHEGVHTGQ